MVGRLHGSTGYGWIVFWVFCPVVRISSCCLMTCWIDSCSSVFICCNSISFLVGWWGVKTSQALYVERTESLVRLSRHLTLPTIYRPSELSRGISKCVYSIQVILRATALAARWQCGTICPSPLWAGRVVNEASREESMIFKIHLSLRDLWLADVFFFLKISKTKPKQGKLIPRWGYIALGFQRGWSRESQTQIDSDISFGGSAWLSTQWIPAEGHTL